MSRPASDLRTGCKKDAQPIWNTFPVAYVKNLNQKYTIIYKCILTAAKFREI